MGLPVPVTTRFACDDVRLGQEITLLSAQINVANYRLLKLIAEFDIRRGWHEGGAMRSCAHWLAAHCGMAIGAAREKVRVARRLAGLPEVEQSRELYWFQDADGMWIIHAKLPPEQGQLVMKALEAVARPMQEARQDEWKEKQKKRMQAVVRHIMRRRREAGDAVAGHSGLPENNEAARDAQAGEIECSARESEVAQSHSDIKASVEFERAEEKISAETFSIKPGG